MTRSLAERDTVAAVFKANQVFFSMGDAATEARRQLPGDPPLTAGCMSCKHSTVQLFQS
jgi:hypothetical protein